MTLLFLATPLTPGAVQQPSPLVNNTDEAHTSIETITSDEARGSAGARGSRTSGGSIQTKSSNSGNGNVGARRSNESHCKSPVKAMEEAYLPNQVPSDSEEENDMVMARLSKSRVPTVLDGKNVRSKADVLDQVRPVPPQHSDITYSPLRFIRINQETGFGKLYQLIWYMYWIIRTDAGECNLGSITTLYHGYGGGGGISGSSRHLGYHHFHLNGHGKVPPYY